MLNHNQNANLALMVEQANNIVSDVKVPVGYPCWRSQHHLFSMIAAISSIFMIDVDRDVIKTIINATNDIAMSKYRIAIRLLWLLRPGQMALFNGIPFEEAAKSRTRAMGFAYIKLCKAIKLGELDASEITSDKGIRLFRAEFKRQLKKPRPG